MKTNKTIVDQLRGATRLAVDATRSVTNIVEAMHHTIGGGSDVLGRPLESATKLLAAPTYATIRSVTNVVGAGLDVALAAVTPLLDQAGTERGPLLAVLNGVLGDYLAETNNPLAIEMRFCQESRGLVLTREALQEAFPEGTRFLVLVHGSCMDEGAWFRKSERHETLLAEKAGFVPIYLRYNSGLHVSQNGRAFSALLEQLLQAWPRPVDEIVLLAHSMGGLVARSACAAAEAEGHTWRSKLRTLVTLGTPHHGAPLERGGNWIDTLLGVSRYSAPLSVLGKLRSAGVTDLRYGNVGDSDWEGQDRFARNGDPRRPLPLPANVACFAIAATTAKASASWLPGDGLVPVDSALGRHKDPERVLRFGTAHHWIAFGATHLDLLDRKDVSEQVLIWLQTRD